MSLSSQIKEYCNVKYRSIKVALNQVEISVEKDNLLKFVNDVQKIFFTLNQSLIALRTFVDNQIITRIANLILDFRTNPKLTRIATAVEDSIKFLTDAADNLRKTIRGTLNIIGSAFGFIAGLLRPVVAILTAGVSEVAALMTKLGPVFNFFKGIVKVFSRLFLPLTIFITAWDTVKGAVDGFKEDGIIGGIEGAVTGFFNSLIFAPLDLIKQAAAFVLGKLGFENAQETLNSFSFQDVFSNLIGGIFENVKKIGSFVGDVFSNLIGGISEDVKAVGSFVGDIFKGEFSLEKAKEALGAVFSLSPVGMIVNLIKGIIPETFEKIGLAMNEFVRQLRVNAEIALLKIVNLIQNVPDQLLKFLSDNLRIQIPRIAIPVPFSGGRELVIAEESEVGVGGREGAARRIAERNARLDARLLELSRQNLADVGGAGVAGTNIVVDNSTVAPSQTSVVNQLQNPIPLSESTERVTLSD